MSVVLNSGFTMPLVGLGTYRLRSPFVEKSLVNEVLEEALKVGYRLIDTASVYQNEENIGTVLRKWFANKMILRSDVFITSKLAPSDQGAEKCRNAVNTTLKKLDLEFLDLYLIHWPGAGKLKHDDPMNAVLRKESWLELEKLHREEKIKSIGISNYTIKHIEELLQYCSVVPAVLQVEFHPHLVQKDLLDFCASKGIHVQAYSSLGAAKGCEELLSDPVVQDIAKAHQKTPAQVLLRWGLMHGLSVIPKTSNLQRLKENFSIMDFSLSSDEVEALDSLDKNMHYCWDPTNIA